MGTRIMSNLIPTSVTREKNFTVKDDIIGILASYIMALSLFSPKNVDPVPIHKDVT